MVLKKYASQHRLSSRGGGGKLASFRRQRCGWFCLSNSACLHCTWFDRPTSPMISLLAHSAPKQFHFAAKGHCLKDGQLRHRHGGCPPLRASDWVEPPLNGFCLARSISASFLLHSLSLTHSHTVATISSPSPPPNKPHLLTSQRATLLLAHGHLTLLVQKLRVVGGQLSARVGPAEGHSRADKAVSGARVMEDLDFATLVPDLQRAAHACQGGEDSARHVHLSHRARTPSSHHCCRRSMRRP